MAKKKNHSSAKECLSGWIAWLSSLKESMMSHLDSRVILLMCCHYAWALTIGVLTQDNSSWPTNLERKKENKRHLSGAWLTIFRSLGREVFHQNNYAIHVANEGLLFLSFVFFLFFLMNCFVFTVPARIVNISQDKSVNEGDDVNLFCLAVGRPEPTITWKDLKCERRLSEPEFHGHLPITSRVITAVTRTIIISICHRARRRCHRDHCNTNNPVCH